MADQNEKVFVRITASQVVHYSQTFRMPKSDWEKFLKLSDDKAIRELADQYIDYAEVAFADDLEDIDFIKMGPVPAKEAQS